jgi:hypothetical protein
VTQFRVAETARLASLGFLSVDELTIEAPDGEQARGGVGRP